MFNTKNIQQPILIIGIIIFIGILITVNPALSVILLLVAVFLAYFLARPSDLGICLLLLSSGLIPFSNLPKLSLFRGSLYIDDFIILLSTILIMIFLTPGHKKYFKKSIEFLPLIFFIFISIIALFRSIFFHPTYQSQVIFREFRPLTYLFLTYFSLFSSIRTEKDFKKIVKSIIILSILIGVAQIVEALTGIGITGAGIRTAEVEGEGMFYNIKRATISGLPFLIFSSYLLTFKILNYQKNPIYLPLIPLFFIGALMFSLNRMTTLTLFIGFIILYWFIEKKCREKYLKIIILFFVLMSLIFITHAPSFDSITKRFLSIFKENTYFGTSLAWRYREYKDAIDKIKENPILGIGFGVDYRKTTADRIAFNGAFSYIHNGYLFLLLKMGSLGFILFIVITLLFFKNIANGIRNAQDPYFINVFKASAITYICLLISSLTQSEFSGGGSSVLFGFLYYFSEPVNYANKENINIS